MLSEVLADIRVPRPGRGRPRTRPDAVLADRAYTSGVNRSMLAGRGIKAVIPQKSNEVTAHKRKASRGGRPMAFDTKLYEGRNVVERSSGLTPFRRSSRYESRPVARGRGQGDWSDHDEQQEASHPGAGRP